MTYYRGSPSLFPKNRNSHDQQEANLLSIQLLVELFT